VQELVSSYPGITSRPLLPFFPMSEFICPCGKPATVRTWESDLYLCFAHGRSWLASPEKQLAKTALEDKNDDAVRSAVELFVARIARKPSFTERVKSAVAALLGRSA
jgi:hypothetical protein